MSAFLNRKISIRRKWGSRRRDLSGCNFEFGVIDIALGAWSFLLAANSASVNAAATVELRIR